MQRVGDVMTFKLVHLSGAVSCASYDSTRYSYWGCDKGEIIGTLITNARNEVVFPSGNAKQQTYRRPGMRSDSSELVFSELSVPLTVAAGQEFRLWYSEDLRDFSESDNGGRTCAGVHALYATQ